MAVAGTFPRRFGKFVLLKPMARGGMGEIYLAAGGEVGFQKFCVIKTVISEKTDRAKANRFLDEAKVVLRLSHANLVPTFDAGEIENEFFIAMDLIEGKDLREIWNRCVRTRTRIPLDVALHIGREIARALAYVHSYGDLNLVHRDVAPPNILVSYFGEVKLTDFGLARSVLKQEHTAPGVVFGRASYLAPEQARGEIADARTDVYSLGIVLWELLTGNQYLMLSNLDPATAMSLVRHPRPQAPSAKAPWITKDLDVLLLKALAPAREDRFQTAEEFRQALSDLMAKMAPRADAERAAAFVRGLYDNTIKEERQERDKLLAESLTVAPKTPEPTTPLPASAPATPLSTGGPTTPLPTTPLPTTPAPKTPPANGTVRRSRNTEPLTPVAGTPALTTPMPTPVAGTPVVTTPAPISLAALDRTKKPIPFPSEDESLAVDFTGRVIDSRYRVVRKIGEGGMGTVYAAEHVEIGKVVAIKILHLAYSNQQDLVERFRREARAASRIGHPNIIDVTDFGSTDEGCAYFVMEHLDGIDLADVLSHERRLESTRACQIAIQICRALAAAHAAGVIHRDLKPENIFLVARDGKADFVKVLDFGIARSAGRPRRLTNPGIAMGTPEYMAPEQAKGGVVDQRSDVYSVGALLYEMVTGSPPQQRGAELITAATLRSDLPEEIDRVITRALEPDPVQRYQSMGQLEYDLVKGLFGRPRAVSELLGLRVGRRRTEASPINGAAADAPAAPTNGEAPAPATNGEAAPVAASPAIPGPTPAPAQPGEAPLGQALLDGMEGRRVGAAWRAPTPSDPLRPVGDAGDEAPPVRSRPFRLPADPAVPSGYDSTEAPIVATAERRPTGTVRVKTGGARRLLGTAAVLGVAVAAAIPLYKKLPWSSRAPVPPPAPVAAAQPVSEADLRAQRVRATTAEADKLVSGLGFDQAPALAAMLERLRSDGAGPAADALATRARQALMTAAEAELEGGEIESGVAHYKVALGVGPDGAAAGGGKETLGETLRARAMKALIEQKDAKAAVRWARGVVAIDADAVAGHALLADMLYSAEAYQESVTEYRTALAGQPDDAALQRGLKRAVKKAGPSRPAPVARAVRPRKARKAKSADADSATESDVAAGGESEGEAAAAPPSAPSEPAPKQE